MFDRTSFIIKERVGLLKLADTYDIMDGKDGKPLGLAQEEPGTLVHVLRVVVSKQVLPTTVHVRPFDGAPPLLTLKRGVSFLRSPIRVLDGGGLLLGTLKSKIFTLGGAFQVLDAKERLVAEVKGDWKGWNFRFVDLQGKELGRVTKEWAGGLKEFFTSADTYVVDLGAAGPRDDKTMALLLAAGLAIDLVFKESD
jgi:uncharacterized protein YxjI